MTFVMTRLDKIRPGFNSCFIVRYLLEKAGNTEAAVRLLRELPIAFNCNILMADRDGYMAVAECAPEKIRIRKAETTRKPLRGDYGFLCQYDDQPDFETVWSSLFDLKSLEVWHTEGDPRKYPFLPDNRLRDL